MPLSELYSFLPSQDCVNRAPACDCDQLQSAAVTITQLFCCAVLLPALLPNGSMAMPHIMY